MTPAELRETAKRLKGRVARHDDGYGCPECNDMRAGADALDRLADTSALGRLAWEAVHAHGAFARDFPDEAYYRKVGEAIARGDTTSNEDRRKP